MFMVDTDFDLIIGWGLMWDFRFAFGPEFIMISTCNFYSVVSSEEVLVRLTYSVCKFVYCVLFYYNARVAPLLAMVPWPMESTV